MFGVTTEAKPKLAKSIEYEKVTECKNEDFDQTWPANKNETGKRPRRIKFRRYAKLKVSTEPLFDDLCSCSNHNFELLDEIDALGLDRGKALTADKEGELHKVPNFMEFKLTPKQIEAEKLHWEILLKKN